jgi:hypothetical protein
MSWAQSSLSRVVLEEALTAELFLEEGTVLVKSPLDPGDTASFTHPQLPAHQPDEAFIMGHQNHSTLKDRTGGVQGVFRGAEAWGGAVQRQTHPEIVESAAQSLYRLHVQVVCGLIQNVEVRAGRQNTGRWAVMDGG